MAVDYSIYGFHVVAEAPIPGLLRCAEESPVDVRIWLNRRPSWWTPESSAPESIFYRSPEADAQGQPRLWIARLRQPGWFHIVYYDGSEFVLHPQEGDGEGEIWCTWPAGGVMEDTMPFLVGPVFGFFLRQRGICSLHASAVAIDGKIIAIMGPPHAGKSSTAAGFASLGFPVVSDDIVPLVERDGTILAQPGYPRLSLWPDVVETLYGTPQMLPRITPETGSKGWWDKRYLDLIPRGHSFQLQPRPLSAIYFLDERVEAEDCPRVEPMAEATALVKLFGNTYMNYLLDTGMRSREFQFLGRLVSRIPVRRVIPHTDPASLKRLCETLAADHAGLPDPYALKT